MHCCLQEAQNSHVYWVSTRPGYPLIQQQLTSCKEEEFISLTLLYFLQWRYCIRLENMGSEVVQLRERHWRIFSLSGTLETVRGRGVVGRVSTRHTLALDFRCRHTVGCRQRFCCSYSKPLSWILAGAGVVQRATSFPVQQPRLSTGPQWSYVVWSLFVFTTICF